jgi:hypothetical protein
LSRSTSSTGMLTVTFTVFAILGDYSTHTNPWCRTTADTMLAAGV